MNTEKTYRINRIFYSIQGEGARVGTPQVFIRFSGCNLHCSFCDTDHESRYQLMDAHEIIAECKRVGEACASVSLCGGEPTLQLDEHLLEALKQAGYYVSIETNGLLPVPAGVDYVVCSPKTAKIAPDHINELRYVVKAGDPIPVPHKHAEHYYLSPCFDGEQPNKDNIAHCIALVQEHPEWRLGMQWHKFIGIE
ncbi:MAG: radical SAM protein [Bacteroidales bacterium]|nr:radical SAM protein [Bacteroidales bacterium]